MPEPSEGPTVLRILLGTQLRRLRESRGITAQEAARTIRGSESKISRIELGRNTIREIDAIVPPPAAGRLGPLRPAYPPATATRYRAAAFAPRTGEYETWGESPPCWYPPMTPITKPWPVTWSISLRKGPPLVPSV